MEPPPLLRDQPPNVVVMTALFGPVLFGLVAGFLLGETEAGWWISQGVGAALGYAGGMEHDGAREGALRGFATALLFGIGIVLADAISGDPPQAEVPDPVGLVLIPITIGGTLLGALGGRTRARAASRSS